MDMMTLLILIVSGQRPGRPRRGVILGGLYFSFVMAGFRDKKEMVSSKVIARPRDSVRNSDNATLAPLGNRLVT